jgi:YVTN family beta-propeller protein
MLRRLVGLISAFVFLLAMPAMAQGPFAYITNVCAPPYWCGGMVSVVDTSTNTTVAQIPIGGEPRSAAVDPSGTRVYIGHWWPYPGRIDVIDAHTNEMLGPIQIDGGRNTFGATGIAVRPDGRRLYVADYGTGAVYVVDTTTLTQVNVIPVGLWPHGLAFNPARARAYVANWGDGAVSSLSVIDTDTETVVKTIPLRPSAAHPIGTNGVAVDRAGTRVYVSNFYDDSVAVIDATTETVAAVVHIGADPASVNIQNPVGIAVNPAGTRVYVANQQGGTVSVIDTSTNGIVATINDVGSWPTGVGVTPSGDKVLVTAYHAALNSYSVAVIDASTNTVVDRVQQYTGSYNPYGLFIAPGVADTTPPELTLPSNLVEEATGATGALVEFTASAIDAVSGPALVTCTPASGSLFPLGSTLVSCSATDASGNVATGTFTVTVRDTRPPVVATVTASPEVLWPPNHLMVSVALAVAASDAVTPAPVCRVASVTSNQPPTGAGSGNVAPDYTFSGVGLDLSLRAERAGSLTDRVYTVSVVCKDAAGNESSSEAVTVVAPHDQRNN